jgi:pyruvate dehydrogenase E1 component beta subunit
VKREGTDVTVVGISKMVNNALEVAQELEGKISVEVIDPRTLEPFDIETVLQSVDKTGHLVVVDEDTERCGFPAELAFQVQDMAFDSLDAPIKRVCAANFPIAGGYMEQHILPQSAQIKAAIEEVVE